MGNGKEKKKRKRERGRKFGKVSKGNFFKTLSRGLSPSLKVSQQILIKTGRFLKCIKVSEIPAIL